MKKRGKLNIILINDYVIMGTTPLKANEYEIQELIIESCNMP